MILAVLALVIILLIIVLKPKKKTEKTDKKNCEFNMREAVKTLLNEQSLKS